MTTTTMARGGWVAVSLTVAVLAAPVVAEAQSRVAPGTALKSLEEQLAEVRARPESAERLASESRLHHFLAEAASSKRVAERHRQVGRMLAERALSLDPKNLDALVWFVAHRGTMASYLNPYEALKIADELERTLLELRRRAPDHEFAVADRVLGKLYQLAPAVISVGSMEKAKFHYEEALRRWPDYPGNRLFYAEYLLSQDECAKARAVLKGAVTLKTWEQFPLDSPTWARDHARLTREALRCD